MLIAGAVIFTIALLGFSVFACLEILRSVDPEVAFALFRGEEQGRTPVVSPGEDLPTEPVSDTGVSPVVEVPWIQGLFSDRSKRSVSDVGQIHLLFVTRPGTDSRMGLSSRVFGTIEAPSKESAQLLGEVGPQMAASFQEGLRYVRKLPRDWEKEFSIRLSFEERTSKDGGSAATAFTIVMLSAIKGIALDPEVAVTGDLTIDGTVQPVGGVVEKVRGALDGKCKITLIPARNARDVVDFALLQGTSPLWDTQIFSVGNIEQAFDLARVERSEDVRRSIERFDALRARLPTVVTPNYLLSPIVQTELKEILRIAPNHLSASTLLSAAENRMAKELSLTRSVEEIFATAYLFVGDMLSPDEKGDKGKAQGSQKGTVAIFPEREYGECMVKLQRLTPLLDRRSLELKAAVIGFASALRAGANYRPGQRTGMRTPREWAEWLQREKTSQEQTLNEIAEASSRLMLAMRKLDTDGSLTSEMRRR